MSVEAATTNQLKTDLCWGFVRYFFSIYDTPYPSETFSSTSARIFEIAAWSTSDMKNGWNGGRKYVTKGDVVAILKGRARVHKIVTMVYWSWYGAYWGSYPWSSSTFLWDGNAEEYLFLRSCHVALKIRICLLYLTRAYNPRAPPMSWSWGRGY